MIKLVIRFVTLATFLVAMIAPPVGKPVFAAGGGGGGGGGGGDPSAGTYGSGSPSYPSRPATKATQKGKKTHHQSSIDDPAFAQGYRAAYATIYQRNDYT